MQEGVSVIIPVFNAQEYLDRCVESAVNQTYKRLEILLISDGSTDRSDAISQTWQRRDKRIIYVRKKNTGLGMTRNLGIQLAGCPYITFLDSDDWLEPHFVGTIMDAMSETGAEIGMGDINYCDSRTGDSAVSRIRFDRQVVSAKENPTIINKARTFACGKIYHRKLFREKVLYPGWTFEDIPCTPLYIFRANKVAYSSDTFYNYWRNQKNSLSSNPDNITDIGRSLRLLYQRAHNTRSGGLPDSEVKKLMAGQLRFAIKKWGTINDEQISQNLQHLDSIVAEYYPSLRGFKEKKFYVMDNDLLRAAVDCVIVDSRQIAAAPGEADYVVGYSNRSYGGKAVSISIPEDYGRWLNRGMAKWEIAEMIMEKL